MKELLLAALKTKKLGRVCKVGAWIVLGLGIIEVALNVIYAWQRYNMYLAQQRLNGSQFGGSGNLFNPYYDFFFTGLISTIAGAIFPIFIFVVLYVAGTIFSAMVASTTPTREETDDIVYESLTVPTKGRE